jgi:hypothetical protein
VSWTKRDLIRSAVIRTPTLPEPSTATAGSCKAEIARENAALTTGARGGSLATWRLPRTNRYLPAAHFEGRLRQPAIYRFESLSASHTNSPVFSMTPTVGVIFTIELTSNNVALR